MGSQRTYFQGWDRELEVIDRAGRGSKVKYVIDPAWNEDEFADILPNELEVLISGEVRDIIGRTGYEVVNRNDPKALGQEPIAQVRPKKARATGHDRDRLGRSTPEHLRRFRFILASIFNHRAASIGLRPPAIGGDLKAILIVGVTDLRILETDRFFAQLTQSVSQLPPDMVCNQHGPRPESARSFGRFQVALLGQSV